MILRSQFFPSPALKRRVVERETAGAGWWDVRFVTDRGGRVEVGQPHLRYHTEVRGVVGVMRGHCWGIFARITTLLV